MRAHRVVISLFFVGSLLPAGCDGGGEGEGEGEGHSGDSGLADVQVADLGPTDTGHPPADLGTDQGTPDSGSPADLGPAEPDIFFPDLGPLDQGLGGCERDGCPGGQQCVAGECREPSPCLADLDCHGRRICLNGGCQEPCDGEAACPGATWCHVPTGRCRETAGCETSASCLPGNVCRGERGRCVPATPPACDGDTPCPGGLVCGPDGACLEPWRCAGEEDCLAGRVCGADARCHACEAAADCTGGQLCEPVDGEAACVEPAACLNDDDCLPGRSCEDAACLPREPCPADPFEPDDEPATAPVLAPRLYDRSLCAGERDRVRFAVPGGSGLLVVVSGAGNAELDPRLALHEVRTDELLAHGDQAGPVERVVWPFATLDTIVELRITGRPADQGAYLLDARLVPGGICPDDEGERGGGDDVRPRARHIAPGLLAGRLCAGDADWFALQVPEGGADLVARLDSTQLTGNPTLGLYLNEGAPTLQGRELLRPELPAGEIFLEVTGGAGPYALLVALVPPAVTARCAAAAPLVADVSREATTAGEGFTTNGCGPAGATAAAIPETLLTFELAEQQAIDLTLDEPEDPDATLALRTVCGEPASELACRQGAGTLHLAALPAGQYAVVVEGGTAEAGSSASVRLTTAVPELPPVNDLCAGARAIRFNNGTATVSGSLLRAGDELALTSCSPEPGLPEIFYSLELTEPSLLTARSEGTTRPGLTLIGSCELPTELGCAAPGQPLLVNGLQPGSYLLVASGVPAPDTDGSFLLRVEQDPPAGPDQCLGAEAIGQGRVFNRETSGNSKYDLSRNGCTRGLTQGPDMPFVVHLERGQTLTAKLETEWDGALYLVRDCEQAEATCVAGADLSPENVEETLTYTAAEAGDFYLIVDAYALRSSGPFRLTAAVDGECLGHRDCAGEARCVEFHCVVPECATDADCLTPGATCLDERCIPPECLADADCAAEGRFCVAGRCSLPEGYGLGSGLLRLPIPDDELAGLTLALEAPALGPLDSVAVHLELTHPYQGDLVVTLVSPLGTAVRLHNGTGGDLPFGVVIFGHTRQADGPGSLTDLAGEEAEGLWLLQLQDLSPGDEGTIEAWGLYLVSRPGG
ncbi:MAG: proprotein convertase P-domain-containing protein [Myxococcota bacterium]|jgi:subtilisin-like proprotein convertase family protein|nr:proprotein convertase P-domain-containing protein [Myxococcota bacterium]